MTRHMQLQVHRQPRVTAFGNSGGPRSVPASPCPEASAQVRSRAITGARPARKPTRSPVRVDERRSHARQASCGRTQWPGSCWAARYTYHPAGRLTSLADRTSDGTPICSFEFSRDTNGNVLTSLREDGSCWYYDYDGLQRLTHAEWKASGGASLYAYEYNYDRVGNRTSLVANGTPTYYTYNAANELVHEVAAGGETAPHPTVRVDEMDEVDIVDGGLRASCPRSPCCPFRPFSSPRSGRWRPVARATSGGSGNPHAPHGKPPNGGATPPAGEPGRSAYAVPGTAWDCKS